MKKSSIVDKVKSAAYSNNVVQVGQAALDQLDLHNQKMGLGFSNPPGVADLEQHLINTNANAKAKDYGRGFALIQAEHLKGNLP